MRTLPDVSQFAEQFRAIAYCPVPACFCGECDDPDLREEHCLEEGEDLATFDCAGCKRELPWCFGADDHLASGESLFDYCDNCAEVIRKGQAPDCWKEDKTIARMFGHDSRN